MLQCNYCNDWQHGECFGVMEPVDANFIHACGPCCHRMELVFPTDLIAQRYKTDVSVAVKQHIGRELMLIRISKAFYKNENKAYEHLPPATFVVLRFHASASYSSTLTNTLFEKGIFAYSAYPAFTVNKKRIETEYPEYFQSQRSSKRRRHSSSSSPSPNESSRRRRTRKLTRSRSSSSPCSSPRRRSPTTSDSPASSPPVARGRSPSIPVSTPTKPRSDSSPEVRTTKGGPFKSSSKRSQPAKPLDVLDDSGINLSIPGPSGLQATSTPRQPPSSPAPSSATPSTGTAAETPAPPSAAHQPERIIIPSPSTDPQFNENDSVTNRVETDGQGGKFRSYFLVPDAYLYRETRSVDQPAMPQEVSHVKHGIQYGVFGQLTGVTRKPKMKEDRSAWHFHLVLTRNGCSLQTWVFGSEEEVNKKHSYMAKAATRIPRPYFCVHSFRTGDAYPSSLSFTHDVSVSTQAEGDHFFEMAVIKIPVEVMDPAVTDPVFAPELQPVANKTPLPRKKEESYAGKKATLERHKQSRDVPSDSILDQEDSDQEPAPAPTSRGRTPHPKPVQSSGSSAEDTRPRFKNQTKPLAERRRKQPPPKHPVRPATRSKPRQTETSTSSGFPSRLTGGRTPSNDDHDLTVDLSDGLDTDEAILLAD